MLNELLQTRVIMDEGKLDEFQRVADTFYILWIELNGREGVTNYIHSIGTGHILFFLRKYGNLYKYSQQGWEHHNKRILGIYHRHTQQGGNGQNCGEKSYSPFVQAQSTMLDVENSSGHSFF